ncbi:hypothetical protein WAI453_012376 [Rhynchosporium graminicola]|uniref:Chromatin modification-related protein n=1 Tax=Rhynchosporium graminicola TaxID=2792576 RepID=A0A1E1KYP1_9HELO|nr:related to component of histone acetyltransferase complex [Rhynchosporium commune]
MPRDDLSIDFVGRGGKMAHHEQLDAAQILEEWMNRAGNLPNEIQHFQEEIEHKDRQFAECQAVITKHDNQIQKWIRQNGSHTPNPKEEQLSKIIQANFDRAELLAAEKVALSQKSKELMDKHLRWIDHEIKTLQDRGEMPNDPDLPSTLRPQPVARQPRPDPGIAAMPLNQVSNNALVNPPRQRHANQYPQQPLVPPHVQAAQQLSGHATSSAPATPASNLVMQQQQQRARESSLGAAANKRQRLTGGVGPLPPSNLANRASSNGPGTPGRGGTPATAGVRAGSAGPRASIKTGGHKKTAPQGSRQSGQPRKAIGKKSNLGRVKRIGNKNSPSTNDDSEGASGSDDEDDEAVTPRRDADGDDEMGELDDEDGADDKKYCICQSVSFGDMVACDNEACKLEWFHWGCVGLKSEPSGIWICPVCTEASKKEAK